MPLTPEDVSNKRFTPVRLREGYDMGEVDQFLDEVETELARLLKENEDLRSQLADGGAAATTPAPSTEGTAEGTAEGTVDGTATGSGPTGSSAGAVPAAETERPPLTATASTGETIRVQTVPQASNAAARLLEIAGRNADELVDGAKNDADRIIGEARTKAERLESESKEKTEREESEARQRAQRLDQETGERREQLFGDLERERDKLNGDVETLRSFEREYRSRLRGYFSQQLEALDATDEPPAPAPEGEQSGKRLRSILGDDQA